MQLQNISNRYLSVWHFLFSFMVNNFNLKSEYSEKKKICLRFYF